MANPNPITPPATGTPIGTAAPVLVAVLAALLALDLALATSLEMLLTTLDTIEPALPDARAEEPSEMREPAMLVPWPMRDSMIPSVVVVWAVAIDAIAARAKN